MEIFLVTASDYDYALIDSSWATRDEAEARIAEAKSKTLTDPDYVPYAQEFMVKAVKLGEVLGEMERYI